MICCENALNQHRSGDDFLQQQLSSSPMSSQQLLTEGVMRENYSKKAAQH
jgi:hypothetical protein